MPAPHNEYSDRHDSHVRCCSTPTARCSTSTASALLAEQLFPGQGEALAVLWRDKQIEYTRLVSMSGRYRPFWDLTRAGLRFAAQLPGPGAGRARPRTG